MKLTKNEVERLGVNGINSNSRYIVNIPNKYTSIDKEAFAYCESLLKVKIPFTIPIIEEKCFYDCVNLEEVQIADRTNIIGKKAFGNCYNLKKIYIPNSVEVIEEYAFENCASLESINIPRNIKKVNRGAFNGCKSLKWIFVFGKDIPFALPDVTDNLNIKFHLDDPDETDIDEEETDVIDSNQNQPAKKLGGGFADVAGLEEIKAQMQMEIMEVVDNPDRAKALGAHLPNGFLLYGPPGCGKTYFIRKLAEEIGFNFRYIDCSDIASIYIHGTQEKIAQIFKEARDKAPTILFFDEIDAMIAKRSLHTNQSLKSEVNEFLTQLNNCGKDNVIVFAATNNPLDIDAAALRSGRLETKIYFPQPDFETRVQLFKVHLKNKTYQDIDFNKLAEDTKDVVSADIEKIINLASLRALHEKSDFIKMSHFNEVLKDFTPSVPLSDIKEHEAIRDKYLKKKQSYKPVGFE